MLCLFDNRSSKLFRFVGKVSGQQSALSSAEYLESAIKIAVSLTEQIDLAETLDLQYGISDRLDVLPISAAHDWAGHVTVHLNITQQKMKQQM
jgi:hypothetical protein